MRNSWDAAEATITDPPYWTGQTCQILDAVMMATRLLASSRELAEMPIPPV